MRLVIGTKLRPLLRTDFSESVSGRFSGIVTTVLCLCNVVSLVICGPINYWVAKPSRNLGFISWVFTGLQTQSESR